MPCKTTELLAYGNLPVTSAFPPHKASNVEPCSFAFVSENMWFTYGHMQHEKTLIWNKITKKNQLFLWWNDIYFKILVWNNSFQYANVFVYLGVVCISGAYAFACIIIDVDKATLKNMGTMIIRLHWEYITPRQNKTQRSGGHMGHALQWRHNERDGVSNHRRLDCSLNRLFRCRSKNLKHQIFISLAFVRGIHRWSVRGWGEGHLVCGPYWGCAAFFSTFWAQIP